MDEMSTIEKANKLIDDTASAEDLPVYFGFDIWKNSGIPMEFQLDKSELLSQLEKEEIPSHIREARLEALKQQSFHFQQLRDLSFGEYTLLPDEKSFLDLTTSSLVVHCVVHFFHPDFRRCAIVDNHFEKLSKKHFKTKFAKINVERTNFLIMKLQIQMLPAILCFKSSMVVDRIIGFEELGNTDDFPLIVLERRLAKSGVIELLEKDSLCKKTIFGKNISSLKKKKDSDNSDDD